jgi:hypothetical protein
MIIAYFNFDISDIERAGGAIWIHEEVFCRN